MSNPIIEIFDAATGENISREMTNEEYAAEKARIKSNEEIAIALKSAELAKQTAKTELFAKLGITEEEAKLLLS